MPLLRIRPLTLNFITLPFMAALLTAERTTPTRFSFTSMIARLLESGCFPDVNEYDGLFCCWRGTIRFGLGAVKMWAKGR